MIKDLLLLLPLTSMSMVTFWNWNSSLFTINPDLAKDLKINPPTISRFFGNIWAFLRSDNGLFKWRSIRALLTPNSPYTSDDFDETKMLSSTSKSRVMASPTTLGSWKRKVVIVEKLLPKVVVISRKNWYLGTYIVRIIKIIGWS